MLDIKSLSYSYNGKDNILHNINCSFQPGDFIALIGPNGSGKTTLIKLITNNLSLDKGKVILNDMSNQNPKFKKRTLYLPSDDFLPGFMSGREYLQLMHKLYDKPLEIGKLKSLAEELSFSGALEYLIDDYSTGMKKKLQIILSVLIEPTVLIFDETLNGMDIESIEIAKKLLANISNENSIIIMCSHDLHLLESLCNKTLVLYSGKVYLYEHISQLNHNLTTTFKNLINSNEHEDVNLY